MALTVRVGNELGAGNPQRAKQATYTAFGITRELSTNFKGKQMYKFTINAFSLHQTEASLYIRLDNSSKLF